MSKTFAYSGNLSISKIAMSMSLFQSNFFDLIDAEYICFSLLNHTLEKISALLTNNDEMKIKLFDSSVT